MSDTYAGEDQQAVASRLSSAMAMGGLDKAGMGQDKVPLLFDLAENIPSATSTSLWNMSRVSNTIVEGGKHSKGIVGSTAKARKQLTGVTTKTARGAPKEGGMFRRGTGQTFNPRYARRMGSAGYIDPVEGSKTYSPFGALSRGGNFAARQASRTDMGAKLVTKMGGSTDATVSNFSRATFGRMSALNRINGMSDKAVMKSYSQVAQSVNMMRPGAMAGGRTAFAGESALNVARGEMAAGVGKTIEGRISGQVAGYFQGAQMSRMGNTLGVQKAALEGGEFFGKGVMKGFMSNSATSKVVGSRAAAMGLRAAPVIGQMMLAHDIGMMAGKVFAHTGKTMIEAGTQLMQPLNKGPLGATFRDNAQAATARQRAMGAISGSRMNAMSVLGNEGSMMFSRFG